MTLESEDFRIECDSYKALLASIVNGCYIYSQNEFIKKRLDILFLMLDCHSFGLRTDPLTYEVHISEY